MHLLVLGANSDMARAIAARFARGEGADLYLASRDMAMLAKRARDLEIRYQVRAQPLFFEATDYASHPEFYHRLDPKPDGVLVAFGHLGSQEQAQADFQAARKVIDINFTAVVSILEIVAADFQTRRQGLIIGLSSVAGERGRQSNYVYGAAKGAFTVYLSGLRQRLSKHRVRVLTVLPGFVATKMTQSVDMPEKLTAAPEEVADDVYRAYHKGQDVVYSRWYWRWIMRIIKVMPEKIFKRLSL
jgi:decaprenylphospho-beta-D-erythro-pentofuranosid-2-ulose 2-reductase